MKVLIYIVCYNAEKHIHSVLTRILPEYRSNPDIMVLISDDCSTDGTSKVAMEACRQLGYANYEVIKTKINQGYGGNQKIGYNYACSHGFDYVILLHGDGQYAPEALHNFFSLFETGADVILGSRMMIKKNALKGGMPVYKFFANMLLTRVQNFLADTGLSEFHSGYRAYSVAFLKDVPFELNSNDFDFDTDILLQAVFMEKEIREFPIETYYGDEKCHVDLFRYGTNILKTSLKFRMQQLGIGCSLKFRGSKQAVYKNKFAYKFSSHYHLLKIIESARPEKILEIGSGPGYLGAAIKDKNIHLAGIDLMPPINDHYNEFYHEDIESFDFSRLTGEPFDMVCLMDVLEHMRDPESLLLKLRGNPLFENALFVFSVPNVAFISIRIDLLFGRFAYADRGILDIDHKRLFTFGSIHKLLAECGFLVKETMPVPPPFYLLKNNRLSGLLTGIFYMLNKILPALFSFQIVKTAVPVPTSTVVLNKYLERFN